MSRSRDDLRAKRRRAKRHRLWLLRSWNGAEITIDGDKCVVQSYRGDCRKNDWGKPTLDQILGLPMLIDSPEPPPAPEFQITTYEWLNFPTAHRITNARLGPLKDGLGRPMAWTCNHCGASLPAMNSGHTCPQMLDALNEALRLKT